MKLNWLTTVIKTQRSHISQFNILNPLTTDAPYHIEPSQLICSANQLTGF